MASSAPPMHQSLKSRTLRLALSRNLAKDFLRSCPVRVQAIASGLFFCWPPSLRWSPWRHRTRGRVAALVVGRERTDESTDHGPGGELRDLKFLSGLSSGKLRELARVVSSDHDAGRDTRDVDSRREERRTQLRRPAIQAGTEGRQHFRFRSFVRREGLRTATPGRAFDRLAYPPDFVERDRPGTHARAISLRLHHRGENVGAGDADFSHAAGDEGGLFDRLLEWRLHGLPCHAGPVEVCRGQQVGYDGGRVRDRLRGVSQRRARAYRRKSQPAPALETSPDEKRRCHDRQRQTDERTGIESGLRSMSQRLGLQRDGGEARLEPARREVPSGERGPRATVCRSA